jgi:hypothetical protein
MFKGGRSNLIFETHRNHQNLVKKILIESRHKMNLRCQNLIIESRRTVNKLAFATVSTPASAAIFRGSVKYFHALQIAIEEHYP